ncbi:uncharacterized protein MELLADRAFT_92620 [Melampsora larici-populina 98AG31]|uniref:Uncharacterized protein n=1 Tax=Melampsora larici-populina (strain 98AG31 / pathotype 3-4-7) TaxID=747676 RepID=F4S276_MELLP|nr:uncharacterized protein MELLADRAFT_92620 [Melampsora larici-populina 98AG31]EGG01251.1 hypothetical protein MELLADRAFT_92620 [Melampsora larici-populina 98AG31]
MKASRDEKVHRRELRSEGVYHSDNSEDDGDAQQVQDDLLGKGVGNELQKN